MRKFQRYLVYYLLMGIVFFLLSLVILLKKKILIGSLCMIGCFAIFFQWWKIKKVLKEVEYPTDKKPF